MKIVEKGPLIRVRGVNQPKPRPEGRRQVRIIEHEKRRKEIKKEQERKKEALIKYTMNKVEKEREETKIIKLNEMGQRAPINLKTFTKKSKVERAKYRLKRLREAARQARETNNSETNLFRIN